MNHLKNIIFLLLCLAVGAGLAKAFLWFSSGTPARRGFEHSETPAAITGVGDAPGARGFTLSHINGTGLPALLKNWEAAFATTVGIEFTSSTTRDSLTAAARAAHARHMTVILLPPPTFTPQNPYPHPFPDIAADAAAAGIDYLCISWLNADPDPDYWHQQSTAIRQAYKGKLILAALPDLLPIITCWDAADIMGAIGPMTIARRLPDAPDDISLHDARVAWDCSLTQWESLARLNKMKLALLHMNVPATISLKLPPAGTPALTPPKNPALQQLVYEALLLETKGRSATTEIMLFDWSLADSAASPEADAPNRVSGLMAKVTDAWDPKKPRLAAPQPLEDLDADSMDPDGAGFGGGGG